MKLLKISTAGVRGIVGQGMSAEVAMDFAQAFATYLEAGSIGLATDARPSRSMMRSAVLSGLLATGARVVDFGIVPSPSARFRMRELRLDGAVIIGAGHNSAEWNALKFVRPDGLYLDELQGEELLEIYNHQEFLKARWDEIQALEYDRTAIETHKEKLLERFDSASIRKRKFKVVVDCCNGPCSKITPALLKELDCEVVSINDDISSGLPRDPNPSIAAMAPLKAIVRAIQADAGFAHDAEGERLGVVTDDGQALDSETMLAVCVALTLKARKRGGPLVTNLSTTARIETIAGRYETPVYRTPVGQAFVAKKALEVQAALGGEGSGQVVMPWFQPGPDGIAAILLFLEGLAHLDESLSTLVSGLPETYMLKENLTFSPGQLYRQLQRVRKRVLEEWGEKRVDQSDGVHVTLSGGWVHIRASGTEAKLRIIVEADHQARAEEIRDQVLEWVDR